MKDRIPRNPGRVLVTPENGAAYYATITRADNPLQEGDALNKLNLLPDEVAEKLGLDPADNPVPADAFEYIAAKALSLRLTVHGGTVEPETASEGNIWVNTSTPISGWAYSLTEPANPTEGKVWLVASAGIALDTLASGNITISPLSARQYIGGVWVTKEAKSFVNGEWKDWLTLLINGADECVDVTGGWESLAVNISGIGTSARALNVTHGADYIQLTGGAGGQGGMYVTKNKITCDGSTSLRISGEIAAYSNRIKIAALSSKGSSGIVAEWIVPGGSSEATAKTYTDETVLSLPAGEYYIAFSIYSTDNQYIRLNKVYIAGSAGGTIQPGGGGGEISAELIEQAVKNYLEANPIEETDPTVPEWAKQPEKPEYTAEEVGAQPAGNYATKGEIPTKTSELNNDSGFITVAVATLLNYYLKSETYSATEVNELINGLSASKVSVSDIINNLTTSVANKPLGADQGVVLKNFIDALAESKLDATSLPDAINTALAQAKASGEFDGEDGKDGTSVTVKSVSESSADGGSNVVTLSDGKTLTVKNGSKGSTGAEGVSIYYSNGKPGVSPDEKLEYRADSIIIPSGRTLKSGDLIFSSFNDNIYCVATIENASTIIVTLVGNIRGAGGKTAYQYAQDGGYTGTEEEFAAKLAGENSGTTGNKWAGKIASFLGDSITRGMNTEKTYHAYLNEMVGFSVCNSYGVSGSTISNYYEAMCDRVNSVDAQSDIVFVFGGTNDFNQNVAMGEWYTLNGTTRIINYDKTTFRGALTTLCKALTDRFPNKRKVLLTPLHRYTYPDDYTELEANTQGLYLADYVDAIKEAGKMYSIPVIDLYGESGLFPISNANAAIYFHTNDKLHPNAAGHRVIADIIMEFLDRAYPMYGEPALPSYTNLVPSAEERIISGDALTSYNGVGYATDYRLSSSGVVKSAPMAIATGFIPVSAGDTIRIGGIQWALTGGSYNYVCAYKSDYSFIGAVYGSEAGYYVTKIHASCTIDYNTPLTTIKLTDNADIAFIRVSCYNATTQDGSKLIITKNEEIT